MIVSKVISKIPVVSDLYQYHWTFQKHITACRGVYGSYQEALQAMPKGSSVGYSQPEINEHHSVAKLTAAIDIGVFNPIDYPVVLWLKTIFSESSTLFDLGGNVGLAYYAYQKYLQYPERLNWLVCEIPEVVEAGRQLAEEKGIHHLFFTTEPQKADGAEILLTCGALQYLETTLPELLAQLSTKPKHVLVHNVPFYNGETFTTIQNIGYAFCPYKIQNRAEFLQAMSELGYDLIDSWQINRACSIPFQPDRFVDAYHGFYFQQKP